MKQFILSQEADADGCVRLCGREYHYLAKVRRMKVGDSCPLVLPSGERREASVRSVDAKTIVFSLGGKTLAARNGPHIVLFQALVKGAKMDMIVRQAVECGVVRIVPFIAERSVSRRDQAERWQRIVREARQQSGSPCAVETGPPVEMGALLALWGGLREAGALGLVLDSSPRMHGTLHGYLKGGAASVVLVIGPEGGFSPGEMEGFTAQGFKPLSLGGTVLRVETAAVYATAAVRMLLLEKTSWNHIASE